LGALIVVVVMVGAIALVHAKNGFNVMDGGMEFQILMLLTGLYLAAKGNDAKATAWPDSYISALLKPTWADNELARRNLTATSNLVAANSYRRIS
jgi:hypothetical protein